jgi:hypothetical protein
VASFPEVSQRRGDGQAAGRISEEGLAKSVNVALTAAFGKADSGEWVVLHEYPNVFLNERAIRAAGVCPSEAERLARRAVQAIPGISAAFTRSQLHEWRGATVLSEPVQAALRSFRRDRSGHVVYQVSPLYVVGDEGTNHGSHWDYDTHVPLMWLGADVKAGTYEGEVSPVDIVPTLLALLDIPESSGSAGCVLHEMLRSPTSGVRECDRLGY